MERKLSRRVLAAVTGTGVLVIALFASAAAINLVPSWTSQVRLVAAIGSAAMVCGTAVGLLHRSWKTAALAAAAAVGGASIVAGLVGSTVLRILIPVGLVWAVALGELEAPRVAGRMAALLAVAVVWLLSSLFTLAVGILVLMVAVDETVRRVSPPSAAAT